MATLTNEQIEQKKQLLAEKMKEMKAIYDNSWRLVHCHSTRTT